VVAARLDCCLGVTMSLSTDRTVVMFLGTI